MSTHNPYSRIKQPDPRDAEIAGLKADNTKLVEVSARLLNENAKLRKVVEAAKEYAQYLPTSEPLGAIRYSGQVVSSYNLKRALAELDEVVV